MVVKQQRQTFVSHPARQTLIEMARILADMDRYLQYASMTDFFRLLAPKIITMEFPASSQLYCKKKNGFRE
jgi:hypothetical protein